MAEKYTPDQVVNGSFGRIWVNGLLLGQCKSFEAKLTLQYEKIEMGEDLSEYQKLIGYTGSGTMQLDKVDSTIIKLVNDGIQKGQFPDIKIVARVADPASTGQERVELLNVTFDDIQLLKFKQKTLGEEDVSFKFAKYNYPDMIA